MYLSSSFFSTSAHFRGMASPITFLQPSLFLAAAFQFRIWSQVTASYKHPQQPLRFPTDLPPITLFEIRQSSILSTCPAHRSLLGVKMLKVPHHHTVYRSPCCTQLSHSLRLCRLECFSEYLIVLVRNANKWHSVRTYLILQRPSLTTDVLVLESCQILHVLHCVSFECKDPRDEPAPMTIVTSRHTHT